MDNTRAEDVTRNLSYNIKRYCQLISKFQNDLIANPLHVLEWDQKEIVTEYTTISYIINTLTQSHTTPAEWDEALDQIKTLSDDDLDARAESLRNELTTELIRFGPESSTSLAANAVSIWKREAFRNMLRSKLAWIGLGGE